MFDIRLALPFALSGPSSSATAPYEDPLNAYTFAIGGIPFLSAVSRDDPAVIKNAEFRKQQVDQGLEPGEQSLTGWWARSQLSFHGGAGLKYSDPALDESAPFRFEDSRGVDVWTPGQVTLLPDVTKVKTIGGSDPILMVGARLFSQDLLFYGNGTSAGYIDSSGVDHPLTVSSPSGAWQAVASDGGCLYYASSGGIWKLVFTGNLATYTFTKLWTCSPTTVSLGWVKGRLMAGIDRALYELVEPSVGAAPFALPTNAVYTSSVPAWRWSSITAGPEAIYAAGYSGNRGSILKVALETDGALPELVGATEVAQLPTGEVPTAVRAYLGSLMVIGTSRGVRVADIESGGGLAYGPLIETEASVLDMVGSDRFAFCARTSTEEGAGLLRLDLSLKHSTSSKYAYAVDLQATAEGTAQAVALLGDTSRVAFSVNTEGIYLQHSTNIVESGYLQTSATRFNTLWRKLFKRLSVRGQIAGSIAVETIDQVGTATTIATLGPASDLTVDLAINVPDTPQEQLGLRLTLGQDDPTSGPTLRGYQLKALPGGPRQHLIVVPLLCSDSEQDGQGGVLGYDGYGWERLQAVMDLESAGSVLLFQELKTGFSTLVTIEDFEFRQTGPSTGPASVWGGVLTLSMRTLE